MEINSFNNLVGNFNKRSERMPVLFVGHGHPINAILDNNFTQALQKNGAEIEKPNAILVISAHWETIGTYISTSSNPRTIYDFGKFNEKLYQLDYPAPGAQLLAEDIINQVNGVILNPDAEMGFDHGAWTILRFLRPHADVPVLEMSIDYSQGPFYHFELGKQLRYLRDRGVLIICSGNIVHNLAKTNWKDIDVKPYDWNVEFDETVKRHLDQHQFEKLIRYQDFGELAKLAIPTNEHYLPMIYSLGMGYQNENITHLFEGYQFGSMSMRCFKIG